MACNCKNTITSFLGGDVPNPTTFLNCGEADGTYNNPLSTGKTQCVAEDNVLRILDEYYISGTVKNSGQLVFERTYTADTENWDEWNNSGDGYFKPILSGNWNLSASTLTTSSNINANGSITTGTHNGSDFLYIERYNNVLPYAHLYSGRLDNNVESGFRFLTRNSSGTGQEAFTILGSDRKATFQGNLVISGVSTVVNSLSATGINVGNGNGVISAATLTAERINSNGPLVVTGNTVMNGTLSASSVNVGNGNGVVSANTFTAPQISIGKELGVITGTTIAGRYSGASITNSANKAINMTVAKFRPGMVIEVDMGENTGDIIVLVPPSNTWTFGKYTFLFPNSPNPNGNFVLTTQQRFVGSTIAIDGMETIPSSTTITFAAGKTLAGTKIEVISTPFEERVMTYINTTAFKSEVTPS